MTEYVKLSVTVLHGHGTPEEIRLIACAALTRALTLLEYGDIEVEVEEHTGLCAESICGRAAELPQEHGIQKED